MQMSRQPILDKLGILRSRLVLRPEVGSLQSDAIGGVVDPHNFAGVWTSKPPRCGGYWLYPIDSTFKNRHGVAVLTFWNQVGISPSAQELKAHLAQELFRHKL